MYFLALKIPKYIDCSNNKFQDSRMLSEYNVRVIHLEDLINPSNM